MSYRVFGRCVDVCGMIFTAVGAISPFSTGAALAINISSTALDVIKAIKNKEKRGPFVKAGVCNVVSASICVLKLVYDSQNISSGLDLFYSSSNVGITLAVTATIASVVARFFYEYGVYSNKDKDVDIEAAIALIPEKSQKDLFLEAQYKLFKLQQRFLHLFTQLQMTVVDSSEIEQKLIPLVLEIQSIESKINKIEYKEDLFSLFTEEMLIKTVVVKFLYAKHLLKFLHSQLNKLQQERLDIHSNRAISNEEKQELVWDIQKQIVNVRKRIWTCSLDSEKMFIKLCKYFKLDRKTSSDAKSKQFILQAVYSYLCEQLKGDLGVKEREWMTVSSVMLRFEILA